MAVVHSGPSLGPRAYGISLVEISHVYTNRRFNRTKKETVNRIPAMLALSGSHVPSFSALGRVLSMTQPVDDEIDAFDSSLFLNLKYDIRGAHTPRFTRVLTAATVFFLHQLYREAFPIWRHQIQTQASR